MKNGEIRVRAKRRSGRGGALIPTFVHHVPGITFSLVVRHYRLDVVLEDFGQGRFRPGPLFDCKFNPKRTSAAAPTKRSYQFSKGITYSMLVRFDNTREHGSG